MLEPIIVETEVPLGRAQAFDAFVLGIQDWWPMDPFSLSRGLLVLEPALGGRIIEVAPNGDRAVWGHVTIFEKPNRIALAWYVGSTVETATQISVTFQEEDPGCTTVRLVQSGWEALGDKAAQIRTQNDGGWRQILGTHFSGFAIAYQKEPLA